MVFWLKCCGVRNLKVWVVSRYLMVRICWRFFRVLLSLSVVLVLRFRWFFWSVEVMKLLIIVGCVSWWFLLVREVVMYWVIIIFELIFGLFIRNVGRLLISGLIR